MADDTKTPMVEGTGPRPAAALTPAQAYVRALRRAEQDVRSWKGEVHHQTIVLAERKARRNMGADVGNSVVAARAALEQAKAMLAKREQRLRHLQDNPPEPPSAAALNQARIAELVDLLAVPPPTVTWTQPSDVRHAGRGRQPNQRELVAARLAGGAPAVTEATEATGDGAPGDAPAAQAEAGRRPRRAPRHLRVAASAFAVVAGAVLGLGLARSPARSSHSPPVALMVTGGLALLTVGTIALFARPRRNRGPAGGPDEADQADERHELELRRQRLAAASSQAAAIQRRAFVASATFLARVGKLVNTQAQLPLLERMIAELREYLDRAGELTRRLGGAPAAPPLDANVAAARSSIALAQQQHDWTRHEVVVERQACRSDIERLGALQVMLREARGQVEACAGELAGRREASPQPGGRRSPWPIAGAALALVAQMAGALLLSSAPSLAQGASGATPPARRPGGVLARSGGATAGGATAGGATAGGPAAGGPGTHRPAPPGSILVPTTGPALAERLTALAQACPSIPSGAVDPDLGILATTRGEETLAGHAGPVPWVGARLVSALPAGLQGEAPFTAIAALLPRQASPPAGGAPIDRVGTVQLWLSWDGHTLHRGLRRYVGTAWQMSPDDPSLILYVSRQEVRFYWPGVGASDAYGFVLATATGCRATAAGGRNPASPDAE